MAGIAETVDEDRVKEGGVGEGGEGSLALGEAVSG